MTQEGDSTPELENLVSLSECFHISLYELVLGKVPKNSDNTGKGKTAAEILEKLIFTEEKKGLKAAGIILTIFVMIDIISMIIYYFIMR